MLPNIQKNSRGGWGEGVISKLNNKQFPKMPTTTKSHKIGTKNSPPKKSQQFEQKNQKLNSKQNSEKKSRQQILTKKSVIFFVFLDDFLNFSLSNLTLTLFYLAPNLALGETNVGCVASVK